MCNKNLFLVDGNSYAYRAYYAIKGLKNSKGFPTNAVYGFFNMLNRIINEECPDYMAVAFDVKAPTFRHEVYEDYKIHRKPMPEDLVSQLPWIKKVLSAIGITICEAEGYEADDVIASLVNKFKKEINIFVVSDDKDILQLIDNNVMVYKYHNGKKIILNSEKVKQKYGIYPDKIPDFLALKGDKSDNIPGVCGIGKKYSAELISQYGGVEDIISNLEKIEPAILRDKIKENVKDAVLSKKLTVLEKSISFHFELGDLILRPDNRDNLIPIFKDLEFNNLIKKIKSNTI